MFDSDKNYTITIKPSDSEGKWVECEDKYDALAEAIILTLKMGNDIHIPEFLIEDFHDRIVTTLKQWDKELQDPEELLEKWTQKFLNPPNTSK